MAGKIALLAIALILLAGSIHSGIQARKEKKEQDQKK